jgi:hypothetical protein
LFQLFRHGVTTGDVPEWLNALLAAEDWGTPPWEIMPKYATRRWWLLARNVMIKERNRAKERK